MDDNNSPMNSIHKFYDGKFRSDEIFQKISAEHVRINRTELQLSDTILRNVVLNMLLKHMRKDKIFNDLFENVDYAGSVSKNLKICKADEYDLNLVIQLPINYNFLTIEPDDDNCGYVRIKAAEHSLNGHTDIFSKIMTGHYLDQNKFHNWMHSLLINALNSIKASHSLIDNKNVYIFKSCKRTYEITCRESNPAFTLQVNYKVANYKVDFDLVACLRFKHKAVEGFRQPEGNEWIAIAKPLRKIDGGNLLWRPGFSEAERQLIKGPEIGHIKPIIRMLKKFRDDQDWINIKSYHIETLFYNELANHDFKTEFLYFSRTSVFVYMLTRLEKNLKDKVLQNYWHKRQNLFDSLSPEYLDNVARQLGKIMSMIEFNKKDNGGLVKKDYFRAMLQLTEVTA